MTTIANQAIYSASEVSVIICCATISIADTELCAFFLGVSRNC